MGFSPLVLSDLLPPLMVGGSCHCLDMVLCLLVWLLLVHVLFLCGSFLWERSFTTYSGWRLLYTVLYISLVSLMRPFGISCVVGVILVLDFFYVADIGRFCSGVSVLYSSPSDEYYMTTVFELLR